MTIDSKYLPLVFLNDREVVYTADTDSQGDPLQFSVFKDNELLIEGYHYALTFGEYNRRVTITLAAPLTVDANLKVLRKTPIENPFAADPNRPFKTEAFEYMLDRATLIQQEIEGHACACPEFPNVPEGVGPPDFTLQE